MTHRFVALEADLKNTPFSLNYQQRTILNHYLRTPVTIIQGLIEMIDGPDESDLEDIRKELREIIKVVELLNACQPN